MTTTLVLCIIILVLAIANAVLALGWSKDHRAVRNPHRPDVTTPPERPEPHQRPMVQEVYEEDDEEEVPLPYDPNNPPKWKIYHGPDGKYACHCHGLPIRDQDNVMLWPIGNGQVRRFCHQWMIEQQRKKGIR